MVATSVGTCIDDFVADDGAVGVFVLLAFLDLLPLQNPITSPALCWWTFCDHWHVDQFVEYLYLNF
jgi:hypothetical protein